MQHPQIATQRARQNKLCLPRRKPQRTGPDPRQRPGVNLSLPILKRIRICPQESPCSKCRQASGMNRLRCLIPLLRLPGAQQAAAEKIEAPLTDPLPAGPERLPQNPRQPPRTRRWIWCSHFFLVGCWPSNGLRNLQLLTLLPKTCSAMIPK